MTTIRTLRQALMITTATLGGVIGSAATLPAFAQEATRSYTIPSQDLDGALRAFAHQSGRDVLYPPALVAGKRSPGAQGQLTESQALSALLAGTGLRFQRMTSGGYTLSNGSASPEAGAVDSGFVSQLPEILVEGVTTQNADIRRTENDAQPYVVFGRDEIRASQATTLEDFLRTRLPMNTIARSESQTPGSPNPTSTLNLRGLGSNQTLILVDGRRIPGVAPNGFPIQPNINGISLSAIERIEVLPSTASGIYGGGATGGVVNIILRRDYSGFDFNTTYGESFRGDAENWALSFNGGLSLEDGRTRIMVSAAHSGSELLQAGDRTFIARARALTSRNDPDFFANQFSPPLGATVNIKGVDSSFSPTTLTLDPQYGGGSLGSFFTFIPLGYAGPGSDGGAGLLANAGQYNLDVPNSLDGLRRGLVAAPTSTSALVNIRRDFTASITAFVDLAYNEAVGESQASGVNNSVFGLPADAPNNPFQQTILVSFPSPQMAYGSRRESSILRATGGVLISLPGEWRSEVNFGWSRAAAKGTSTDVALSYAGATSLATGLPSPDGRPALNVLQEQNAFPLDYGPYLLPSPNRFTEAETTFTNATLRLAGPLVRLPAGPLTLSALLEHRSETAEDAVNIGIDSFSEVPTYAFYPERSQDVFSTYVEANVPLIPTVDGPALELQLSARHDRYKTRSVPSFAVSVPSADGPFPTLQYSTNELSSTDYTVGLRYRPVRDLTLRASYGTGFLPPSVAQIASTSQIFTFGLGILDPKRGNSDAFVGDPYTFIQGGNPNLRAEQSESFSAGLIFTPRFLVGLRLSIDYTQINKVDEIQSPDWLFIIANEDSLPGRIERGPNLPGDPAGWAGPITSFDATLINIASTSVEAYDLQADYTTQVGGGDLRLYAVATYMPSYENQLLPLSPVVNKVSYSDGPLAWRGNAGFSWDRGPLTVAWNTQFYDSYLVFSTAGGSFEEDLLTRIQGSRRIETQVYHDILLTYRLGSRFDGMMLSNSEISVGIQNLFDQDPPIVAAQAPSEPGYSTYGDPRLRRFTVSLRKSF
jgi:outer membrane receptor protein involved in Fe transport